MNTRLRVLEMLRGGLASGSAIARRLGCSRQAVNQHLQRLVESGDIVRVGRTRGATFRLADPDAQPVAPRVRRSVGLRGLEEDRVYEEVAIELNLAKSLRSNVEGILRYAFTEMMNNAIDHSGAARCEFEVEVGAYEVRFVVRDRGRGVFATIREGRGLPSEEAAVVDLLKGRTTTMPSRHSGEGLFFTSRIADTFHLRSHATELAFLNREDDRRIAKIRFLKGTEVEFRIRRQTRRELADSFRRFAPEEFDYRFERTEVRVSLNRQALVSRSEARRLLAGLERFREVLLDFRSVDAIGQGFADETFRVFAGHHTGTRIRVRSLRAQLLPMIRHVLDNCSVPNVTIE